MQTDQDRLVDYIKAQVEAFLKEMEDFYPFGAAITTEGELKPLGAYLKENELSFQAMLTMLAKHMDKNIISERFSLGAITINVTVKEDDLAYDGVQVRFYERVKAVRVVNYKYHLDQSSKLTWL